MFSSEVLDDPIVADEQAGFKGGQVSNSPARKLRPDEYSESINCDLTLLGDIVTRRGTARLSSGPVLVANLVKGMTYYDTNAQQRLVAATGNGTFYWNSPNWTSLGAFPHGNGAASSVRYAQGIDRLYMADGVANIWSWDGTTAVDLGNAAANQPPAAPRWISWHANRLCATGMDVERDAIYFSQLLNGAVWDKALWQIRVGAGEDDKIMGLVPWTNFNLVVLKQRSIWLVNCTPTLDVADFPIKCVHRRVGCSSPETAVQVGSDVFFLSDSGVRSLKSTLATEDQSEVGEAMSAPIQDIINRIGRVSPHYATFWNNRYILSVTVDAGFTSYVLVYNTLTDCWSGYWTGLGQPSFFSYHQPTGSAPPRLVFAKTTNGEVHEWLDYQARVDEVAASYQDQGVDIPTTIRARAFDFGERQSKKTGLNAEIELFDSSASTVTLNRRLNGATTDTSVTSFAANANAYGAAAGEIRKAIDLQSLGQFRELQLSLTSTAGKLGVRSIRANAFVDTVELQN